MKQYCIITTGYNHSGKSTLARSLQTTCNKLVVYENDAMRSFFKDTMPVLYQYGYQEVDQTTAPDIKSYMLSSLIPYIYTLGLHGIIANCFAYKDYRTQIIKQLIKTGFTPILMYCNPPKSLLYERLEQVASHKDPALYQGKIYGQKQSVHKQPTDNAYDLMKENLNRMMEIYEAPSSDECNLYYERTTDKEYEEVLDELRKLLSSGK